MADTTPKQSKAPRQAISSEKKKLTHPTYAKMMTSAVSELKNKKGITLAAIKNYISSTYNVPSDISIHNQIKKTVTKLIEEGQIAQVHGSGFSSESRFKLVENAKKILSKTEKVTKNKTPTKKKTPQKTTVAKKTPEKKTALAKKTPEKKKPQAMKATPPAKRTTTNSKKSEDVDKPKKKTSSKATKENTAKESNKDAGVKTPTKTKRSAKA